MKRKIKRINDKPKSLSGSVSTFGGSSCFADDADADADTCSSSSSASILCDSELASLFRVGMFAPSLNNNQ